MHYHLEIVMPPTDDVNAAVTQILAPFSEHLDDSEDHSTKHAFWDYWRIGHRWSGAKLMAALGKDRISDFYAALSEAGITVSGLQFGKQTLNPSDQADKVDMMWRDAFPDSPVRECPIFDNYKGNYGDVLPLRDCRQDMTCDHVIIAGPKYNQDGLEADYMVTETAFNGVTHQRTAWDQTLGTAIAAYSESLKNAKPEWAAARIPADDWLVVTIDYHS